MLSTVAAMAPKESAECMFAVVEVCLLACGVVLTIVIALELLSRPASFFLLRE